MTEPIHKRKRQHELDDNEIEILHAQELETKNSPKAKRVKTLTNDKNNNLLSLHGIYRDSFPPTSLDCMPVTSSITGEQVFVTLLPIEGSDSYLSDEKEELLVEKCGYLERPICEMIEEIEERMIIECSRKAEREKQSSTPKTNFNGELFVDKYAPKLFTDLLTNEKFNREVLKWVQEWDPIVFPGKHKANSLAGNANNNKKQLGPEQKILLISGPPGIGKTTLAHVVAKHAGYRPVEINASDDRSSDKLTQLIINYTQTQSMFGDKKPILLIIDEIDGLHNNETKSAISSLLKLAYPSKKDSKVTSDSKNGTANKKKSKKKKANIHKLSRPIICICNDHYAPVLRELRLKSKLLVFRRKETQDIHNIERLVDRISFICNSEGLDFPKRWIRELAIKSDGDIRSCLNTIQFIASGKHDKFNLTEKDSRKDFFGIMEKIFNKKQDAPISPTSLETTNHLGNILNLLNDETDRYETLLMACFENYPTIRYSSSLTMRETVKVLEWTSWIDNINLTVKRNQAFALSSYAVFPIALYHLNCSSIYKQGFHKYNYPKKDFDAYREREQRKNICRNIFSTEAKDDKESSYGTSSCMHFDFHPIRSSTDLQLDIIPQLVGMLFPSVLARTKSSYTIYNTDGTTNLSSTFKVESERLAVKKIIDLCAEYGLTFRYNYNDGTTKLELDPPIHKLNDFTPPSIQEKSKNYEKKSNGHSELPTFDLPYSIKKIIASEIQNVKTRLHSKAKENTIAPTPMQELKAVGSSPLITPTKKGKSLFTSSPTAASTHSTSDCSIYFSYHDGHTNAIRRPAKLRVFL
jgi:chromosome transmission fidelity protein 18